MVRLVTLLLLVAIALPVPATRANAGEQESICHVRSVREVMARELHKGDYYARVIPDLIAEIPDTGANTVLCDVMDWSVEYDARVAAGVPIGRFERHMFRVRAVSNGFVVGLLR